MRICVCDICGKHIELSPKFSTLDTSILGIALDLCPECREWAAYIPRDTQISLALEGIRRERRQALGMTLAPHVVDDVEAALARAMRWRRIDDTSPDPAETVLCIGEVDGTWRGRFGTYTHDGLWMIETTPGTWCYLPSSRLPYWLPIGLPSAFQSEETDRSPGPGTGGDPSCE